MPAAWRERAVAACTERLGYKAAAIFLALALWIAAHVEEGRLPVSRVPLVRRLAEMLAGAHTASR